MVIEVCDLCRNQVHDNHKTEVIIKDHKGIELTDSGLIFPAKRKFKGVICDACLYRLRGSDEKEVMKHR